MKLVSVTSLLAGALLLATAATSTGSLHAQGPDAPTELRARVANTHEGGIVFLRWSMPRNPNAWYRFLLHQADGETTDLNQFTPVSDDAIDDPTLQRPSGGFQIVRLSPGTYSFYVSAFDASGESAPSNFVTVTILGAHNVPGTSIDSIDLGASHEPNGVTHPLGGSSTIDIGAHNGSNRAMAFELLVGPDGMTIDANNGNLSWAPTAEGKYAVVVMATYKDEAGVGTIGGFTVNVTGAADAPSATSSTCHAYPNPAGSNVRVEFPSAAGTTSIVLSDLLGRRVLTADAPESAGSYRLDTAPLTNGSYFITIRNNRTNITLPLTVAH